MKTKILNNTAEIIEMHQLQTQLIKIEYILVFNYV